VFYFTSAYSEKFLIQSDGAAVIYLMY